MKRLLTVWDEFYYQLVNRDWDAVGIIGGGEGKGKSNLGLNLMDIWYQWLIRDGHLKEFDPEYLMKFCGLSIEQFLEGFKELKKFYLELFDEAGELSSLRMMNKFNYAVTKTYEVVRGANLNSLLILPDVFYINPFFSTRRARFYIHVYKRGRIAFWDRPRLQKLIEINKTFRTKSVWRVPPLFYDTFPKYKGELLKPYLAKKKAKIDKIRIELYDKMIVQEQERNDLLKATYSMMQHLGKKLSLDLAQEIFSCSRKTLYNRKNDYIELARKEGELV